MLHLIETAIKTANSEIEISCKQTPTKPDWWEKYVKKPWDVAVGMIKVQITGIALWPLKLTLGLATSDASEKLFPMATMLLRHAKDRTDLTPENKETLANKIKMTDQWKDFFKDWPDDKIVAKVEADNMDGVTLDSITFGLSESDLYLGLHEVNIYAKKENDIINIYVWDTYDYKWGDNPVLLGLWWQDAGLIETYDILIFMKPVIVIAEK